MHTYLCPCFKLQFWVMWCHSTPRQFWAFFLWALTFTCFLLMLSKLKNKGAKIQSTTRQIFLLCSCAKKREYNKFIWNKSRKSSLKSVNVQLKSNLSPSSRLEFLYLHPTLLNVWTFLFFILRHLTLLSLWLNYMRNLNVDRIKWHAEITPKMTSDISMLFIRQLVKPGYTYKC